MKKILVHGVHRSGTSLISSLLAKAGYWYAENEYQMPPQRDNPKGFWERIDVVELNDLILSSENLNWFTLIPELLEHQLTRLNDKYEKDISVIAKRINQHENWFLKDPRLCLTWPLWRKHLSPTHHLVIHRHPVSVAKSLNRRNAIPIQQGLMFWYHQTRMIAKALHAEINVINLGFGKIDNNDSNLLACINQITENSNDLRELKSKDFASLFSSNLVNHVETESNNEVLKDNKVIEKAWDYAKSGDFKKLLDLPEFLPRELSWQDLDSNYAFANQINKSEREIFQHQAIIKEYSEQIVVFNKTTEDNLNFIQQQKDAIKLQQDKIEELWVDIEQQKHGMEQQRNENVLLRNENELQINEIELQRNEIDHLNERMLNICSQLKHYMNSNRYLLSSAITKIASKLGLLRRKSLDDILNIAKFGYSAPQLEQVLPATPNRNLLLKAMVNSPSAFVRRINPNRMVKGVNILLGKEESSDLITRQALLQYNDSDFEPDMDLDTFSPDNSESWCENALKFDMIEKPKVSIVIPVYNNYLTTLACLHSIKKYTQCDEISYEVIIADDCSTDETSNIENLVNGVRVVRGESNLGFLENCNHAVPHAKGEFIVLLNNDTNVQNGWLKELLKPLENDPKIGVTGPMFVYPDGRLQEAGGIIFSDASGWNYGRFDQPTKPEYNFARDVDYISGACLVFRLSLWNQIGGFDEVFIPAYYEDTDFCFEVRKRGLLIRYVPTAKVIHFEGVSHGSDEDSGIKQYQVVNRQNFLKKWKSILKSDHYRSPDDLFLARKHGKNQKVLLYIDHYVPFYDQDTGSKLTKGYIDLMIEENVRVVFLGANFYPHEPYTSELQESGVEVLYGKYYQDNWLMWLEQNIENIDAIYLNRPHITLEFIDKIKALKDCPNLAYNPIDLHYMRVARQESLGVTGENGGYTSEQWKSIEFDLMRKCDVSFYFSDAEIEAIKLEDPTINAKQIAMYWFDQEILNQPVNLIQEPNLLFVGGFGHPPNKDGLEWFLQEIFPQVVAENPDVKLTVIGSKCPKEVFKLESDNIRILGQVSEEVLDQEYKKARVSIVPLRYGAGVKGKVIESMKYRVNIITTSIGSEGLQGDPTQYLNVFDEADEFASNLSLLLTDDDLCKSKQKYINQALGDHFSVQAAKKIFPMIGI